MDKKRALRNGGLGESAKLASVARGPTNLLEGFQLALGPGPGIAAPAQQAALDGANAAIMANNYDWFGGMNCLEFMRDIGSSRSRSAVLK